MQRLTELIPDITYDICVLTGDYRGTTFGPFDAALEGLARVTERGATVVKHFQLIILFVWDILAD
jgi:hypothetical protein